MTYLRIPTIPPLQGDPFGQEYIRNTTPRPATDVFTQEELPEIDDLMDWGGSLHTGDNNYHGRHPDAPFILPSRSRHRLNGPIYRRNELLKKRDFLSDLRNFNDYRGMLFHWKTVMRNGVLIRKVGIAGVYILTYSVVLNMPLSICIPFAEELSTIVGPTLLFAKPEEFYNRMRLIWRRVGIHAYRYHSTTEVYLPDGRTIKLTPGDNHDYTQY